MVLESAQGISLSRAPGSSGGFCVSGALCVVRPHGAFVAVALEPQVPFCTGSPPPREKRARTPPHNGVRVRALSGGEEDRELLKTPTRASG